MCTISRHDAPRYLSEQRYSHTHEPVVMGVGGTCNKKHIRGEDMNPRRARTGTRDGENRNPAVVRIGARGGEKGISARGRRMQIARDCPVLSVEMLRCSSRPSSHVENLHRPGASLPLNQSFSPNSLSDLSGLFLLSLSPYSPSSLVRDRERNVITAQSRVKLA